MDTLSRLSGGKDISNGRISSWGGWVPDYAPVELPLSAPCAIPPFAVRTFSRYNLAGTRGVSQPKRYSIRDYKENVLCMCEYLFVA